MHMVGYQETIDPIPITIEILQLIGFNSDDGFPGFGIWYSPDKRIEMTDRTDYLNTFSKWHVHVDTEDFRTIGGVELSYVHELQHFLKLCNIDINIDLYNQKKGDQE